MSEGEGFHAPICSLCTRIVLARLARFSGRCPIRLPTRNVLRIALRALQAKLVVTPNLDSAIAADEAVPEKRGPALFTSYPPGAGGLTSY